MAPWAKVTLVVTMLLWTGLIAVSGWFALRDHGGAAHAEAADGVIYDVAAPGAVREIREMTPDEARTIAEKRQLPPLPTPTAKPAARSQPVPKYAGNAGGEVRARPVTQERSTLQPVAGSKGVIVLDPGHGRGDPGAVHYFEGGYYAEADSNLRNAELVRDRLVAMGYEVYLTRDGEGVGPGRPLPRQFIVSDLYSRVQLAKSVGAELFVAFHGNGASVKSIRGAETWYCGKHAEGSANEDLARRLQGAQMDALAEYGYDTPDRGIKEDAESHHSGDFCQFVVTREAPVPSALIEFLFLSNEQDGEILRNDRVHVVLADHMATAIGGFMRDHYGR